MKRIFFLFLILFLAGFVFLFVMEGPFFDISRQDLRALIPADLLVEDSWYGIYFNGDFAGYSHSLTQLKDNNKSNGYLLQNTINLTLPVFSVMQPIYAQTEVEVDSAYLLQSARFLLHSAGYRIDGNLLRNKAGSFDVALRTPGEVISKTIPASRDIVNAIPGPVSFSYVPLKKKTTLNFFDPLLNKKSTIILENRGLQKVPVDGVIQKLYVIDINAGGVKGILYADAKGRMVKEEFMGFSFVKSEADKLISRRVHYAKERDLADYFVVDPGAKPLPVNIKRLKLRIKNIDSAYLAADYNQSVVEDKDGFIVEVSSPASVVNGQPGYYRRYLGEDDFIKFNDPAMRKVVDGIVGQEKDPMKVLEKIANWIDTHIAKIPTVSFPNSLDVLRLKRGDCNELSALEIAMLRSRGIPAYVNIGLVYNEGKFYYHAWPSVYVGRWIDTDPALGQVVAGVRRIKLLKGFNSQFELFKVIGKIKVEIIDYD
jgi:Transglutaminase-like superfamily